MPAAADPWPNLALVVRSPDNARTMSLQADSSSGVTTYNLSAGKSMPEWVKEREKGRSLRYDEEYRRRIDLIQGFDFPGTSQCIEESPNGEFLCATGVHAPRLQVTRRL